jgi:poly-gamma-glutamate capsule biosynthesis protein CapA/YwtB (metallophosphatase superfamily)
MGLTSINRPFSLAMGTALACLVALTGCSPGSGGSAQPTVAAQTPSPTSAAAPTGNATAPSTGTAAAGSSFTLVATGDVLLHPPLWTQARQDARRTGHGTLDFAPMLAGVKPYVSSADLAICHLETPLADPDGPFRGYPDFSGPPQIVAALKTTGYDACSTASNHTLDQGVAGIKRTLDTLDAAGIAHAGSARSRPESGRITMLNANGVKVAFLSYAYGFNGHNYPGGQSWRANEIDKTRILADARRARADGAQVVVLAMHWGTEYHQEPSAQQRELAPVLARSGVIDLIISHHAHVVEPIQKIGTTWVVYGLGNLIADHSTPGAENAEGLLARFTFTRSTDGRYRASKAEYLPLLMTKTAPLRLLDVPGALATREYGTAGAQRLREALTRTTHVVLDLGADKQGLVPATGSG